MEENKKIFDNERPVYEVLVDFEEFLLTRLKTSSVKIYMWGIKRYFKDGNKIDDAQNYVDFIVEHMIKKKSSHYYDIILKFVNWLTLERHTKKLILSAIKSIRKKYHIHFKLVNI